MAEAAGPYRLVVSAKASSVAAARLFVGVVARTAGSDEELIEDLKLAVSEALTAAVLDKSAEELSVSMDPRTHTLVVAPVMEHALSQDSLAMIVISELFSEAVVADDRLEIRFGAGEW